MPSGNTLFHKHEFKSLDVAAVPCKMTAYTKGERKMHKSNKRIWASKLKLIVDENCYQKLPRETAEFLVETAALRVLEPAECIETTIYNRLNRLWVYPFIICFIFPVKYILQGEWGLDYPENSKLTRTVIKLCGNP